MSGIVVLIQAFQEFFSGVKTSRALSLLKLLVVSYLFFLIFQNNAYPLQKLIAVFCFFLWFSFWEIKNAKPSIYPAFIYLATESLSTFNNKAILVCMGSMALYSYAKFCMKNKYGVSNLVGMVLILCCVCFLFLGVSEYVTLWLIAGLLLGLNFFYNPFINYSSHKTEFFLGILFVFLYLNDVMLSFNKYSLILSALVVPFVVSLLFLERKKMELVCISQLSFHLILMSKSSTTYFFYSLAIIFVLWTLFEYISRNNNDFLSKVIILIFASDLPFTPFFISKLKTFSGLYIEAQWVTIVLLILFSLLVTGNILVYSYQSLISFAKIDKVIDKTSKSIFLQRTALTVFFLLYTLLPLILFKQ